MRQNKMNVTTETLKVKTSELTPEDKQAKLERLVTVPEDTLRTYKVKELRELAKGMVNEVNGYNKVGLLTKLIEIRSEELHRLELLAIVSKESTKPKLDVKGISIKERFALIKATVEEMVSTELDELLRLSKIASYAAKVVRDLETDGYAKKTIKGMLTDIGREIVLLQTDSELLRMGLQMFRKTLWVVYADVNEQINEEGKQTVVDKLQETTVVKGTALISKAETVLKEVVEGKQPKWTAVAAALALVTGRRSAEIMSSAKFKYGNKNNELLFTGQLKAKGEKRLERMEVETAIPCLVDNELAIEGLSYLDKSEVKGIKRRSIPPEQVNDKYSRELQREMTNWYVIAGDSIMFKDLRSIYAALCRKAYYMGDEKGAIVYYASILGHNAGDLATANTYRLFEV